MRKQQFAAGLSLLEASDAPEGLKVLGSSFRVDAAGAASARPVLRRVLSQGVSGWTGIGAVDEIENQKEEIQRLLASEAELKALAGYYEAAMKEKEEIVGFTFVNGKTLASEFPNHETEVKQLRSLLDMEREISANLNLKVQEERRLNESSLKELHYLKRETEKEKEEMTSSLQQLEKALKDAYAENHATQVELSQLKQHLVDKELENSKKLGVENKIMHELLANSEFQKSYIAKLEKTLEQEVAKQAETGQLKNEVQKLNEVINGLNHRLAYCTYTITSQKAEVLNLQIALDKCSSDCKAMKSHEIDLASSREKLNEFCELLKVANNEVDKHKNENIEISSKLSHTERTLSESKRTIQKLQEEISRLHQMLEENMAKINGAAVDSEYLVDRRIVSKLLVTYFQKNNSKEVLNLMVRMLGFSKEDMEKIGFTQEMAKGTVVDILGLPICLGDIFGVRSSQTSLEESPMNKSIADHWVEFLLNECDHGNGKEPSMIDVTASETGRKL